jgi:hypothetical protein
MQMKRMDTWLMMSWYSHRPEAILQFIHDRQRKIQDMTNIQIVTQAKTFGSCCFVPPIFQSRISITIFHWKWLDQTPEKKTNDSCSCVCLERRQLSTQQVPACTSMICSLQDFLCFFSVSTSSFSDESLPHFTAHTSQLICCNILGF